MRFSLDIRPVQVERLLFLFTVFLVVFPLKLIRPNFGVVLYQLPLLVLISLSILRVNQLRIDKWLVLGLGAFTFYVSWALLGLINSSFDSSYGLFMVWVTHILLFIYAYANFNVVYGIRDLIFLFKLVLWFQVFICSVQFVTFSTFGYLPSYFGDTTLTRELGAGGIRIIGSLGSANSLALMINLFFPLLFFEYSIGKSKATLLLMILSIGLMIISLSRFNTSLLILQLSILPLFFRRYYNLRKLYSILFLTLLLLAITAVFVINNVEIVRIAYEVFTARIGDTSKSSDLRQVHLEYAFNYFVNNPLFGSGFENGGKIYEPMYTFGLTDNWDFRPHNLVILMLTESGIFGFISFFTFVFILLMKGLFFNGKTSLLKKAVVLSLISFFLASNIYLIVTSYEIWPLFLLFLVLLNKLDPIDDITYQFNFGRYRPLRIDDLSSIE